MPDSGVHQLLSMKLVPALNEQMTRPLEVRLQRPQLKSFPHLNGLYLLLRGSGLARLETVGKQRLLRLDEEALGAWRQLNPTEQYFNLLETWLWRASEDLIGERDPFTPLFKCLSFLQHLPPAGAPIAGTREEEGIRYYPGLYNLALLEEFGFLEIAHGKTALGGGWRVEREYFAGFRFRQRSSLPLCLSEPFWREGRGKPSVHGRAAIHERGYGGPIAVPSRR